MPSGASTPMLTEAPTPPPVDGATCQIFVSKLTQSRSVRPSPFQSAGRIVPVPSVAPVAIGANDPAQSETRIRCSCMKSEQPSAFQSPVATIADSVNCWSRAFVKAAPKPFDSIGVRKYRTFRSRVFVVRMARSARPSPLMSETFGSFQPCSTRVSGTLHTVCAVDAKRAAKPLEAGAVVLRRTVTFFGVVLVTPTRSSRPSPSTSAAAYSPPTVSPVLETVKPVTE